MKKFLLIFTCLYTLAAFATSTPTKFTTDVVQFGHSGSTANHILVYDFGLGASNPAASVDNATHTWNFNYNGLEFGDGTSSDKTISANLGGTIPKIIYSASSSQWQFSNDGTNFSAFGSGSGGAGINLLQNPGFESGLNLWTNSGLTTAVASSGSNLLFDKKSATLVATAGSQFFEQAVVVPNGLAGTNCAASVWYLGGDANMVMHFTDNSNVDLGTALPLYPVTTPTQVYINGICPAGGSNAKIRFVSVSSTSLISIDNASLGNATNLFQASQDQWVGSVVISGCSADPTNSSGSFASLVGTGCTFTASGAVQVTGTQHVAVIVPNGAAGQYRIELEGLVGATTSGTFAQFQATDGTNVATELDTVQPGGSSFGTNLITQTINEVSALSNTTFEIKGRAVSGNPIVIGGAATATATATIRIYRMNTPAQTFAQSQCQGSGACVNHVSAAVTATCSSSPCTIASQNVPWLASITRSSAGTYVANFAGSFFTANPVCAVTAIGENTAFISVAPSASSFTFVTDNSSISPTDSAFSISCDKQGTDVVSFPQPVLVGGVSSGSVGQLRLEGANVNNTSGSSSVISSTSPWITTASCGGTGNCTYTITGFSTKPYCACSPGENVASICNVVVGSSTSIMVNTLDTTSSKNDTNTNVMCFGSK